MMGPVRQRNSFEPNLPVRGQSSFAGGMTIRRVAGARSARSTVNSLANSMTSMDSSRWFELWSRQVAAPDSGA